MRRSEWPLGAAQSRGFTDRNWPEAEIRLNPTLADALLDRYDGNALNSLFIARSPKHGW
jgi:hypothetical protein